MENKKEEPERRALLPIGLRYRVVQGFQLYGDDSVTHEGKTLLGRTGDWFLLFDYCHPIIVPREQFSQFFKVL